MALTGKFRDTPFTDLVQFYAASRQTVAVTVSLPDGEGEDGVFYIEDGDVVDAWLGDAVGRDAVRRAMGLADGSFRIEPNVHAAERTITEPLRQLLLEETSSRTPSGVTARDGGAHGLTAPAREPVPPLQGGPPAPRQGSAPPSLPEATGGGRPARKGTLLAALAVAAALLVAIAIYLARSGLAPGAGR